MTKDVFQLTQAIFDQIVAHAREGKPQEVCGLLRGRGRCAFEAVRSRNLAPDPIRDYQVDPQTLLMQFEFEEAGDEMVAIYHSHPASPAYPSASDAWNAHYPECAYLICSLENDHAADLRAFRLIGHDAPLDPSGALALAGSARGAPGPSLPALRATLDFDETRPGRFAHYQTADAPVPPVLRSIVAQIPLPFYVVFEIHPETGKILSPRLVSVKEERIQILPQCP